MNGSDTPLNRIRRSRRSPRRSTSSDLREWIMFLVAIGIIIYFAVRGNALSAWWLMLLGSMLGLSMLVAGIGKTLGMDQGSADDESRPEGSEEPG